MALHLREFYMKKVLISGTGLFTPEESITNQELIDSFNAYVELFNQRHAAEIELGHMEEDLKQKLLDLTQ